MKRLLRNKANFSVLEGFLSELLQRDIKILRIIESEGNQAYINDKFNRVDLLAEDETGEIFIIEVQNQDEYDYFHRMAYGVSKAITEYLNLGQPYSEIKKVYSVNIVYFDLGQGDDYVYHGVTDFYGIHKNDKLLLSEKQKNEFGTLEPKDIFPEYYVLKVNSFDDVAKDTLDEWIYYFKNNEIKDSFKAKGLEQAKEILKYDQLPEGEKITYRKYMEDLTYKASMNQSIKITEKYRIRKEAKEEAKEEIAKKLKDKGLPVNDISEITGLTKEEIESLK
jgi:predicted transposase/invertase (TIGR01784 family)